MGSFAGVGTEPFGLFKDHPSWSRQALAPANVSNSRATLSESQQGIHSVYNRLGGLMRSLADDQNIRLASVIAIWVGQGTWRQQRSSRAFLRLNLHELFEIWGKRARSDFDLHFRFGGHNLQPGHPWENHEYRTEGVGPFSAVQHNQNSVYEALTLTRVLAGDEIAFSCLSIGGPQLPISNHLLLGYDSASQMYRAFQESESNQVLSFFDYCRVKQAPKSGNLVTYLRNSDWANFVRFFRASGEHNKFAEELRKAEVEAESEIE